MYGKAALIHNLDASYHASFGVEEDGGWGGYDYPKIQNRNIPRQKHF